MPVTNISANVMKEHLQAEGVAKIIYRSVLGKHPLPGKHLRTSYHFKDVKAPIGAYLGYYSSKQFTPVLDNERS